MSYTKIPLAGLRSARADPNACKGSIRVFGNGGLYSFTGIYSSSRLGRYRMFATDLSRAVVLTLPNRMVVLTPADQDALLEYLRPRLEGRAANPRPDD